MDPLSQGVFGTTFSQQVSSRKYLVYASFLGFLSGMAPDLDIFIRSSEDTLLFLDFHRQFTHSLIFIPFGALFCAAFFYLLFLRKKPISFAKTYLFCFFGYASHGLLDSCTSYGTQLFWPFSNYRVAWNNVSIIDPLFTMPTFVLLAFALLRKKKLFSVLAILYAVSYLSLGFIQENRAKEVALRLAASRGHQVERIEMKPSFSNLILWKSIYEAEGRFYVDAIRVTTQEKIYEGESLPKLDIARDLPWVDKDSVHANDIKRFTWFSQGFVAMSAKYPDTVIDIRYSLLPNQISSLWGLQLNRVRQDKHAVYSVLRRLNKNVLLEFKLMLKGK